MTDLLTTIVVVAVANGGLGAVFVYVFKQLFERALDSAFEKKLKAYQHELDLKAEAYKREIELANQKTLHSYSRLFDEQAGVIKEVYSDLISIYRRTSYLIYHVNLLETAPELFENRKIPKDGDPIKWEWYLKATMSESQEDILAKDLYKATKDIAQKVQIKRIYFSRLVADEVERLVELISFIIFNFQNVAYRDPYSFEPVVAEELIQTWKKAVEASNQLFPVLEDLFREHLGIKHVDAQPRIAADAH